MIILSFSSIYSQTIRLVRTDVDSARAGVITAGYLFGLDFKIDDLDRVNGAFLTLKYNNSQHIKYSGYSTAGLGDKSNVTIIAPSTNSPTGEDVLTVVVYSGEDPQDSYYNSPVVVHLEFVVTQTAIHKQEAIFSFVKASAGFYDSTTKEVINVKLKNKDTKFTIHSYTTMWPGDTDNSGLVDVEDWISIDIYRGQGNNGKRKFKRSPASTMWMKQTVLAWDDELQSYSDCDGDGEVTLNDALVVTQNLSKARFGFDSGNNKPSGMAVKLSNPQTVTKEINDLALNLNINTNKNYTTLKGKVKFDASIKNFKGINLGELFNPAFSKIMWDFDYSNNVCEFIVSNFNSELITYSGNALEFVFANSVNNNPNSNFKVLELKALNEDRDVVDLLNVSDVEENTTESNLIEANFINNQLILSLSDNIETSDLKCTLYDIRGIELANYDLNNQNFTRNLNKIYINLDNTFSNGIYLLRLTNTNQVYNSKISIFKP